MRLAQWTINQGDAKVEAKMTAVMQNTDTDEVRLLKVYAEQAHDVLRRELRERPDRRQPGRTWPPVREAKGADLLPATSSQRLLVRTTKSMLPRDFECRVISIHQIPLKMCFSSF